jgi:SAM-dependent methyltransferase
MSKLYDRAYFDRWYRHSKHERASSSLLKRKVHLAVSVAEYYLERPIKSVLDVGCGEAVWRAPLLKLRPKLEYRGVDSSEYAVTKFGRTRNIAFAQFSQLEQLRFGAPVDLLVCSDVMHYLSDSELKRGLKGFSELCQGVAFLELWSREDDIVGDKIGFIGRPANWYRKQFAKAGFIASGSHCYLSPGLHDSAAALEVL